MTPLLRNVLRPRGMEAGSPGGSQLDGPGPLREVMRLTLKPLPGVRGCAPRQSISSVDGLMENREKFTENATENTARMIDVFNFLF